MTKETKIGLLVGLAFIILFAIILSEKGNTHRDGKSPMFTAADTNKSNLNTNTNATNLSGPLNASGHLSVAALPPIVTPSPTVMTPPMMVTREEQIPAGSLASDEPSPRLPAELAKNLSIPRPPAETNAPLVTDIPKIEEPVKVAEAPVTTPNATETSHNSVETPASLTQDESKVAAKPEAKDDGGVHIRTVYTIQPGESLGKVAAKFYGRSTPARVDALVKANKDVIRSASAVRAGDKVKIPELGIHSDKFEAAPQFLSSVTPKSAAANEHMKPATRTDEILIPAPIGDSAIASKESPKTREAAMSKSTHKEATLASARKSEGGAAKFELYEVKKSDTLSSIARRELGSEKRWREISGMNKDTLSKKMVLKPGMKLKIPARATSLKQNAEPMITSNGLDRAEP